MRCDEIVSQKNVAMNVTDFLLVVGQDMMRLPFRICCNVTHLLLVIGQDVVTDESAIQKYLQCYSLPVGHRTRCDDVMRFPFRKFAKTHFLLV